MRPRAFDGQPNLGLLVHHQVVEHDDTPGRNVGSRTCSTYARKVGLSIGPSKTAGAVSPSRRKPAITVCVCQWLHGV